LDEVGSVMEETVECPETDHVVSSHANRPYSELVGHFAPIWKGFGWGGNRKSELGQFRGDVGFFLKSSKCFSEISGSNSLWFGRISQKKFCPTNWPNTTSGLN